jgi:type IV secretory pathway TrbD component
MMSITGVVSRILAVGIFVGENVNHVVNFEQEVATLVHPALQPLPTEIAMGVHALTICLGIVGSVLLLISERRQVVASRILSVFMILITWNWWLRRFGVFVWDVPEVDERRMRTIHCLKNLSIFGFLLMLSRKGNVTRSRKDI